MSAKVSIVMPVFNMEKCLADAIESITTQTFSDFELICVNDGSTDSGLKILEGYAAHDSRIRILTQENQGTSLARKSGVLASTGKFVMFIDPDDQYQAYALEEAVSAIESAGVDILQFSTEIKEFGSCSPTQRQNLQRLLNPSCEVRFSGRNELLRGLYPPDGISFVLWNKIFRGDICRAGFSEVENQRFLIGEDGYALFLTAWYSRSFASIRKKLYIYRIGKGITNSGTQLKKLKTCCRDLAVTGAMRRFGLRCTNGSPAWTALTDIFENHLLMSCWEQIFFELSGMAERKAGVKAILEAEPGKEAALRALVKMRGIIPDERIAQTLDGQTMLHSPSRTIRAVGLVARRIVNGGVERVVSLLSFILKNAGFRVVIFSDEPAAPEDYPLSPETLRIVLPKTGYERYEILSEALRNHHIDLLFHHVYYSLELLQDLIAAKAIGLPTVITHHSVFPVLMYSAPNHFRAQLDVFRLTDLILTLSHTDERFFRLLGCQAEYMPNPLTFHIEGSTAKRSLHARPTILFPARISREKQPQEALYIFHKLRMMLPQALFIVAGDCSDTKLESELRESIHQLGLEDSVHFLGYCQDMRKVFQQGDVMLMTSIFEGFPMALLEAKASGMPAVAYDLPYVETMKPDTGVVAVPSGNRIAAAHELFRLLTEPERYSSFSDAAIADARKYAKYDFVRKYTDLFRRLATGKKMTIPDLPEKRRVLETIFSAIPFMRHQLYAEGARDKSREITAGLTYKLGYLLTALPIRLKQLFWGHRK